MVVLEKDIEGIDLTVDLQDIYGFKTNRGVYVTNKDTTCFIIFTNEGLDCFSYEDYETLSDYSNELFEEGEKVLKIYKTEKDLTITVKD
jgi:hypothetical protein